MLYQCKFCGYEAAESHFLEGECPACCRDLESGEENPDSIPKVFNSRKIIGVSACAECPHLSKGSGHAPTAYVPYCTLAKRELPYTFSHTAVGQTAILTPGIPEWCPLEEEIVN